ncbi:MAG TPA: nucleotide sugar dehydrogenase, partial [Nocardioides sp.]|nr:nucleotide sugar dehydrogenase [Nocardioides sp.]
MRASVVGLGKIGLPLAVQFAGRGIDVVGLDVSRSVVDDVNRGIEPFPGESDLDTRLKRAVDAGRLRATSDAADAIVGSEVVVIVVPLVVDDRAQPDFTVIDAATETIAPHLSPGALVLYETTLPLGTTRGRLLATLERITGGRCGERFLLAFSPERVYSGRIFADLRRYPKLVGGVDAASAAAAVEFYRAALEFDDRADLPRPNGVWDLGSAEAAELAKLAETTYRDVNIAFANELTQVGERLNIDVLAVIEACNSQPFSHIHRPGVAVGGHCIPVYPRLLLATADLRLPAVSREVNEAMPSEVVEWASGWLGGLDQRTVAILGVAYRGGVKEVAFSGAFALQAELAARGARPLAHDPLFSDEEIVALGFVPYRWGEGVDLAIVQADHAEYAKLGASVPEPFARVYDGRGVLEP